MNREILERYRRTKKGVIRNIFCHIKERCIKYNRELKFNSDMLLCWAMNQSIFHSIYNDWVKSEFIKETKPSIDRKNPLLGYSFDNIQVVTYKFNRDKGDKEKEILWGIPIIQCDLNGKEIKRFSSIKQAVIYLNIKQPNISSVLLGHRKKTCGYKFKYQSNIYNNPELLKQ